MRRRVRCTLLLATVALAVDCTGATSLARPAAVSARPALQGRLNVPRSYSVLPPWARQSRSWEMRTPAMLPAVRSGRVRANVTLYASAYYSNVVYCYSAASFDPAPFASITSGISSPQGMASSGDKIIVANTGGQNVLVFKGCGKRLLRTLQDPSGYPCGVAVDGDGNVYVTNIFDVSGKGEIRKYGPGDNHGGQIGDPNLQNDYFVAVDPAGDLFVDGFSVAAGVPEVDWLPAGLGTQWENTGISPLFPGGLAIDANGNLVVDDQGDNGFLSNLTAYTVPGFVPAGSPIYCPGPGCSSLAFDQSGKEGWIAGFGIGAVWAVSYPQGVLQDEFFTDLIGTPATGVAVTPQ